MMPFLASWVFLAFAVAGLAGYRKLVAMHEDDMLHVRDSEYGRVAGQAATAHRLEVVDRWGKLLTVVAAAYGLLLAGVYVYQVWLEGSDKMWS